MEKQQHPWSSVCLSYAVELGDRIIAHSWTRKWCYYIHANKGVDGLLHTTEEGGGAIAYDKWGGEVVINSWTRRQCYYTQLEEDAGLINLGWSQLCSGHGGESYSGHFLHPLSSWAPGPEDGSSFVWASPQGSFAHIHSGLHPLSANFMSCLRT